MMGELAANLIDYHVSTFNQSIKQSIKQSLTLGGSSKSVDYIVNIDYIGIT